MMVSEGPCALYRYWRTKHVHGRPPSRRDIDPVVDIPHLAKNLLLIDVMPDGYAYRVVGSELARRHGVDLTGRRADINDGNPAAMRAYFAALDAVVGDCKPRYLESRLPDGLTAKYVVLMTPLVGADGRTEMILTGSFYDGHFDPAMRPEAITFREFDG